VALPDGTIGGSGDSAPAAAKSGGIEEAIHKAWAGQMRKENHFWYPQAGHHCRPESGCQIDNPPCLIYGLLDGASHVCTPWCTTRETRRELHMVRCIVRKITNYFICRTTGKGHLCEVNLCTEPHVERDGSNVCPMSGLCVGRTFDARFTDGTEFTAGKEASRREKATAKRVGETDSAFSNVETQRRLLLDKLFPSFGADRCGNLFFVAYRRVELLLFSNTRLEYEAKKERDLRAAAEAEVIKYLKHCSKSGEPKILQEMERLYLVEMFRKHIFPTLLVSDEVKERLCSYYAMLCMELYDKLDRIKKKWEEFHVMPTFQIYVTAMLYRMKDGITKRAIEIVPRDVLLSRFLPDTNTLDVYDIVRPVFTAARNKLSQIINVVVDNGIVHPGALQLTTLSVDDVLYSREDLLSLMEARRKTQGGVVFRDKV
jgi:hypothetical protein